MMKEELQSGTSLPPGIAVRGGLDSELTHRVHAERPHAYRTPFARDGARILHARAFRRLAGKTQVFTRLPGDHSGDHFRSRLTHTLEVTQIARTMSAALGLNTDLTEALALVHDIGHPPFGHAGEKALDHALRACGLGFDHNLHALRIVSWFEERYAAFRGLNLTLGVREGIIKHSRDYDPKKFPQLSEYLLDQRPPLEAQLIDLADEIAYNTADLDDGFEARLLSLDDIRTGLPIFEHFYREVDSIYPTAQDKLKFNETIKRILDRMVGDFIENTKHALRAQRIQSLDAVRQHPTRLVGLSAEVEEERRANKQFLYDQLYFSPALSEEKDDAEVVVKALFAYWMEQPAALPHNYQEKAREEPLPRIICDYIAGMTDHFIYEQYDRFCGH